MSERTIADDLVDWFVYAPIGAVVTITEDLPGLVEKGRRRMRIVRFAGNVALKVARYRIDSYLDTLRTREPEKSADETEHVAGELEATARTSAAGTQTTEAGAASPNGAGRHEAGSDTGGDAATAASTGNGAGGHDGARPAGAGRPGRARAAGTGAARGRGRGTPGGGEALAIPDYDTLAAAQIVKLLPGLSRSELEAVRRHELAGRSRATVLNRIAQLTDGHTPRTRR